MRNSQTREYKNYILAMDKLTLGIKVTEIYESSGYLSVNLCIIVEFKICRMRKA